MTSEWTGLLSGWEKERERESKRRGQLSADASDYAILNSILITSSNYKIMIEMFYSKNKKKRKSIASFILK